MSNSHVDSLSNSDAICSAEAHNCSKFVFTVNKNPVQSVNTDDVTMTAANIHKSVTADSLHLTNNSLESLGVTKSDNVYSIGKKSCPF